MQYHPENLSHQNILIELGFKIEFVGEKQYQYLVYNNCYCKITYLEKLNAFVIESADNLTDAMNGVLEDGGFILYEYFGRCYVAST